MSLAFPEFGCADSSPGADSTHLKNSLLGEDVKQPTCGTCRHWRQTAVHAPDLGLCLEGYGLNSKDEPACTGGYKPK